MPYFVLTGAMSGMFVTAAVKPFACMCSTHFAQQPQVGLLYTVRCGVRAPDLSCACAATLHSASVIRRAVRTGRMVKERMDLGYSDGARDRIPAVSECGGDAHA